MTFPFPQLFGSKGPVEMIQGVPVGPAPSAPDLGDLCQCLYCGDEPLDVGGELRNHINGHISDRLERVWEER